MGIVQGQSWVGGRNRRGIVRITTDTFTRPFIDLWRSISLPFSCHGDAVIQDVDKVSGRGRVKDKKPCHVLSLPRPNSRIRGPGGVSCTFYDTTLFHVPLKWRHWNIHISKVKSAADCLYLMLLVQIPLSSPFSVDFIYRLFPRATIFDPTNVLGSSMISIVDSTTVNNDIWRDRYLTIPPRSATVGRRKSNLMGMIMETVTRLISVSRRISMILIIDMAMAFITMAAI